MARRWVWTLLLGAAALFGAGVLETAGAAGLAWTNTGDFCIGCHEMKANAYAEFKGTIHDKNRTGVRAICSDCRVPHEPIDVIKRKVAASLEVWGLLAGVLDTPEKYEAKEPEGAGPKELKVRRKN